MYNICATFVTFIESIDDDDIWHGIKLKYIAYKYVHFAPFDLYLSKRCSIDIPHYNLIDMVLMSSVLFLLRNK